MRDLVPAKGGSRDGGSQPAVGSAGVARKRSPNEHTSAEIVCQNTGSNGSGRLPRPYRRPTAAAVMIVTAEISSIPSHADTRVRCNDCTLARLPILDERTIANALIDLGFVSASRPVSIDPQFVE